MQFSFELLSASLKALGKIIDPEVEEQQRVLAGDKAKSEIAETQICPRLNEKLKKENRKEYKKTAIRKKRRKRVRLIFSSVGNEFEATENKDTKENTRDGNGSATSTAIATTLTERKRIVFSINIA